MCISKIIANRVKEGLGDIVSINQSAFMPDRRISDNILLTQELMRNYHRRRGPPRIINLCFADDLFLFSRGHPSSVSVIMDALDEFKQVSSLVHSIPKSTAYFCNVPNVIKASILNSMSFTKGVLPVSMPKHEGGLGIRRIENFNIALMATHIWSILTHRESLWVKWVHTYKLKGRSFWDLPCRGDASWGWRKLLQIRSTIRPFIWHKINNGKSTSVWFDRWTDVCPLKDLLSNRDIVRSGFSLENSFSHCIPRHAIHMWLVIQQKLKTQDRLRQWDVGPSIDLNLLKCPLCDLVPDSHDHLFFECSFSSQVWSKVRVLCGMDAIPPHLSDVVAFIVPLSKGKTVVSIISRIVVAATSYYIWLERNGRLFKKKTSTPGQIVDVIFSTMRLKLVTFKFKKMSTKSRLLLDQWKIPSYCIVHDGSTRRQPSLDLYCFYRVAAGLRDARLIVWSHLGLCLLEVNVIKQSEGGILINHEKYVKNLLKRYDINGSSVKTPMVPPNKLGPDLNGKAVNETWYRGMIGSLMYLTASKPDIQFSSCLHARYQANLQESHLITVKKIFRYPYFVITSAITISNNLALHSRTKHINIRYYFIRDHILKRDIKLHFIPTQYQLADIFTKPLDKPTFKRLIVELVQLLNYNFDSILQLS
ncbi:reverse transcriptase domain, reverse transcriptase zinc-binding domain protein [Tanacetum coccineum]